MRWLRLLADCLLFLLAAISIPITGPALILYLAWQARKQKLEVPFPDPISKQRTAHFIATEGHHEPRNSSDETPPENHAA
jgi:hypothetical protein